MKRLNILFIVNALEPGGFEFRLLEFAKHFPEELGISIVVTSRNLSLLEEFEKTKADIKVIPVQKAYLELWQIIKIAKYTAEKEVSIINSFDLKGLLLSVVVKTILCGSVKIVYNCVNLIPDFNPKQKYLFKTLLSCCDKCLSNSISSKHKLELFKYPSANIEVIHNGVDENIYERDEQLRIATRQRHNLNGNIVLGTIANFRTEKNYPFLLRAFSQMARVREDLRLICVGGGPELESIKLMSESLGLSPKVIFTGHTRETPAYLNAFDCFILCSSWEGFPNVVLQAMSAEVPVIVSAVGGCVEVVRDFQTGVLFEADNMEDFCCRLESIISDRMLRDRLSATAKKLVHDKFALSIMLNKYTNFYSRLQ